MNSLREELLREGWVELQDGQTVSPAEGDKFFAIDGKITVARQTGGYCGGFGNSNLTSVGQVGGVCWVDERGTVTSISQVGGFCCAYGDYSTLKSTDQIGGHCWGRNYPAEGDDHEKSL